jgi:peptide-methionine (R)-S-oxide reductase
MDRRGLLMAGASVAAGLAASWAAIRFIGRTGERYSSLKTAESAYEIAHSEAEWRRRLTEAEFLVLRQEQTERPFSSPLNDEKRAGTYHCAGCELAVYSSSHKYDSGTGWPSFFTTIPNVFETQREFAFLIPRTEYHCVRCRGHHGHVFDDGPPPTNERWCNNGVALRFVARDAWSSSAFGSIADEQVDQRPGIT